MSFTASSWCATGAGEHKPADWLGQEALAQNGWSVPEPWSHCPGLLHPNFTLQGGGNGGSTHFTNRNITSNGAYQCCIATGTYVFCDSKLSVICIVFTIRIYWCFSITYKQYANCMWMCMQSVKVGEAWKMWLQGSGKYKSIKWNTKYEVRPCFIASLHWNGSELQAFTFARLTIHEGHELSTLRWHSFSRQKNISYAKRKIVAITNGKRCG